MTESLEIVKTTEVIEILKKYLVGGGDADVAGKIIRTKEDYFSLFNEIDKKYGAYERILGELCFVSEIGSMKLKGYCCICGEEVDFELNTGKSELTGGDLIKRPLWIEKLRCPKCGLNNRMRHVIGTVKQEYTPGMKVYMYEQITNGYKALKKTIPDLVGSEYLGEGYQSGDIIDGILHEDAMNLSFSDESFDMIVSLDVFEHVPDYKKAFSEMARVLKSGKKAYITVPFASLKTQTERRACFENGEVRHLMEPLYHGNPLCPEKGSFVYQIFSWDILEQLKECGFREAYAVPYYSIRNCNLGNLPIYIEALK